MKKNRKVSIFILPFIALVPFFCVVLIINLIPKNKEEKNTEEEFFQEIQYKNIIDNAILIDNNLDLQSIFLDSSNSIKNYAVFTDKNIYYSYEPSKCYNDNTERLNLEERIKNCKKEQATKCTPAYSWKEDCQEGYCENYYKNLYDILGNMEEEQLPLCKTFSPNNSSSRDELNKRYIIKQDLDGNNLKLLETYESKETAISFNYITDNNIYYEYYDTYNLKNGVKQLNASNNITLIKENNKILNYPISNKQFVFLKQDTGISKYDELNNKTWDVTNLTNNNYILDKYTNDFYSYNINNKEIYLYKNNDVIFKLEDHETPLTIFSSYKNVYLLYLKNDLLNLLILNKKDNKLEKDLKIENLNNIKNISYLTVNSNGLICLIINNNDIYTLNPETLELNNIYNIKYKDINNYQIYHNFIIYFYNNSLIIYNTITNEEKIINNVIYYYLNIVNNKLYVVINENNELKLNSYNIN